MNRSAAFGRNRHVLPVFFLFLTLLQGCVTSGTISAGKIRTENYRVDHGLEMKADLIVPVTNGTPYKIRIRKYSFSIHDTKNQIGMVAGKSHTMIPAHTDSVYVFPVNFDSQQLLHGGIKTAIDLLKRGETEITVSGKISGRVWLIPFRRKIRQTAKLTIR